MTGSRIRTWIDRPRRQILLKKLFRFLTSRLFISIVLILIQLFVVFYFVLDWGYRYFIVSAVVGVLIAVWVYSSDSNPSYKNAWILLILALPVFGSMMYVLFGNKKLGYWGRRKIHSYAEICSCTRTSELPKTIRPGMLTDDDARRQSSYISRTAQYEAFAGSRTTFYSLGDKAWPAMRDSMKEAKHFIMLEFFIFAPGQMWDECLEILKSKVSEGVDVYLMYDDMGSINTVSSTFDRMLRNYGIHAIKFNPIHPRLSARLNYRDHRKICIIDGNTAFNGGINFSDEYINRTIRFGHWKDTMIRVEGTAVWNYTLMFIQLWSFSSRNEKPLRDVSRFFPTMLCPDDGMVQPYGDSPLDDVNVSENVYLQMINSADRYVWITTPYLILDNEMITALTVASQSGVDVRIITPHYPDKKIVFSLTRANYRRLVQHGVKIYEYTPGFIHSKVFISDDKLAIVGTANMDYRSFYLNFECGTLLNGCSCIKDIKADFDQTIELSQLVTMKDIRSVSLIRRIGRNLVNLAAPLL